MDVNSVTASRESSYGELFDQNNSGSRIDGLDRPPGCGLCQRPLTQEDELNESHQNVSVCEDCKFLLLENFGTPTRNSSRRRLSRRSLSNYNDSDSAENLFSQQFSELINLARHLEPGHEEDFDDNDFNSRFVHPLSFHSTPNDSTRWRRINTETASDISYSDSYYGESESNVSYGAYYQNDSDDLSFNTYEGDSDTSVGGRTFFNADIVQSVGRSDPDSDSDIDPMHAGNVQWDLTDHELEDPDWEEDTSQIDIRGGRGSFGRYRRTISPESSGIIRWRVNRVGLHVPREVPYIGDHGNYLDAQGFEEFLENVPESASFRRGAPPASTSFINNLPIILICEEHQKPDGLACAICKDLLTIGTEVNKLPCLHLYHPLCILPWLKERNTCPLCRYELPTDRIEFANRRLVIVETEERDDSSSTMTDSSGIDEFSVLEDLSPSSRGRGGWLLSAAAPIVSLMGIAFVLWLGNPLAGRGQVGEFNLDCRPVDVIQTSGSSPHNERGRRWWLWF